jgi:ABC-2 type transport system permease protein
LGGVFFPMSYLPDVIEPIASLNPILLVVTSFRYAVLGVGAEQVWVNLGILAILTTVIFSLAAWMLHRRIGLSA